MPDFNVCLIQIQTLVPFQGISYMFTTNLTHSITEIMKTKLFWRNHSILLLYNTAINYPRQDKTLHVC